MIRVITFAGRLLTWLLLSGLLALDLSAQTVPLQRTLPYSKAEIEKALRGLQAYKGGRLPILDGFVVSDQALDHYERPFYQYSVQVTATGPASSDVRVSARITAWYTDPSPSQAGYRLLTSNGRLEADLMDRLGEALNQRAGAAPAAKTEAGISPGQAGANSNAAVSAPQPSRPSLPLARLEATAPPELSKASRSSSSAEDRHIQQLSEEAKNLEQILRTQSHPDNLAVIKSSRTPVMDRPDDGAKQMFLADAEDEFQIIDTNASWVHVQVSGLSRGWIRRSDVLLPAAYERTGATEASDITPAPFRQTRQEIAAFPGKWEALSGKQVKVVWVQPSTSEASEADKFNYAKAVFRRAFPDLLKSNPPLAGVVIVFDSEDGGMTAATLATLQQWSAHHMTDNLFRKQCWFDPADAFRVKN